MWVVRKSRLIAPTPSWCCRCCILILSPLVILRTPTDIFPNINIPVIAAVWNYNGLNAEEVEGRRS